MCLSKFIFTTNITILIWVFAIVQLLNIVLKITITIFTLTIFISHLRTLGFIPFFLSFYHFSSHFNSFVEYLAHLLLFPHIEQFLHQSYFIVLLFPLLHDHFFDLVLQIIKLQSIELNLSRLLLFLFSLLKPMLDTIFLLTYLF